MSQTAFYAAFDASIGHDLSHTERTRLVHSSRKLGKVLGTVPQFLSHPPLPSSSDETRAGHRPSKSITKLVPQTRAGGPLVLNLVPGHHRASVSSVQRSPLSPTFSMSQNASTKARPDSLTLYRQRSNTDARRKRIAKLTRTLGENIPPELVLPIAGRKDSLLGQLKSVRRRSYSVDGFQQPSSPVPVAETVAACKTTTLATGRHSDDRPESLAFAKLLSSPAIAEADVHIQRTISRSSSEDSRSSLESIQSFWDEDEEFIKVKRSRTRAMTLEKLGSTKRKERECVERGVESQRYGRRDWEVEGSEVIFLPLPSVLPSFHLPSHRLKPRHWIFTFHELYDSMSSARLPLHSFLFSVFHFRALHYRYNSY